MSITARKAGLLGLAAVGVMSLLAACSAAPSDSSSGGAAKSDFLPCMVSDSGGFDDHSFNQLGYEGLQQAAKSLNVKYKQAESKSENDFAPNIQSMVDANCNLVVTVGFLLKDATEKAAKANPDVDFAIIDDNEIQAKNVKPIIFDTAQAAFLAGYASASYSADKDKKVGTFGGMNFPTVSIFMDGFKQGVDHYNEVKGTDVQVVGWDGTTGSFTGGFEANQDAKQVAVNVLDQDVDVIFPVGGPIYQSAQQAIKESGKDVALIGADADLFETDPSTADVVLTSVLKAMDLSTYEAVLASGKGEFDPETYIGTLENEGVGIADLHNFADKVDSALQDEVAQLQQDIIDGTVTVNSYLSE